MEMPNSTFKLTPGQQKAVDIRNANVLVAAAAGSGKTKVLVDRIVGKVTDVDDPVNVDEFLVVTFTNAAAAQMRDKIRGKLREALEAKPENEHLSLQQLLVNRADICTIDSFCLKLVRENFNLLDIDSSFAIGDPGMMEMVKAEVMDKLFERLYDEGNEEFKLLVDIFGNKNQEEELKKAVTDIYYKASSSPVPALWLDNAKNSLLVSEVKGIDNIPWVKHYMNIAKAELLDVKSKVEQVIEICETPGGPDKYLKAVCQDVELVEGMLKASTYEELYSRIPKTWPRIVSCKGDSYDQELIASAKAIREEYKDVVKKRVAVKKSATELLEELNYVSAYLIPLIELTKCFMDEYMQEKKARRMLEFSDIEHMAHSLVCFGYDQEGNPIPTELAKNISEGIREIYIDEYQDSNFLQEDILTCVSGNYRGQPNMFMVGDVKQSIYRFRMARPDLFIGKYNSFTDAGDNVKILLNNNFRSRDTVLIPTNYFFYQLMGKDLGDIVYDREVSLVPSMEFPKPLEGEKPFISSNTEVMILNLEKKEEQTEDKTEDNKHNGSMISEDDETENMKNLELEAYMIAGRIKKLVDKEEGMLVYDEELKIYRRASYKDIVILARSIKDVGEQFYNVLNSCGIPVYVLDPKGYFDAVEIKVVMSLLSIVDNSKQDIPLAAVLLSPIGGFDESELARVCDYSKLNKLKYLYDKCQLYILDIEDDISKKLKAFFEMLDELKEIKNKVSISQLIWKALELTGYYTYVSAMPMGHRRKANLDMLLEKADAYEDGYYKGLFNFLRYVEKLKVNQVDFGEAAIVSDDENVVRIMTMHASKGLEYPIVFVSALGKQFNKSDYKDNLIINSDYYLAMKYMNRDKRYSKETFAREAFKEINKSEGMAEELRILYVALTRAKEKLIITGHTKRYSKLMEKFRSLENSDEILLPYGIRKRAQCFVELIIAAMMRFDELKDKYNVADKLTMEVIDKDILLANMVVGNKEDSINIKAVINSLDDDVNQELVDNINTLFNYLYPYERYTQLKSKLSVSDIKKQKAFDGAGYDQGEFQCKALDMETFQDDLEELEVKDENIDAIHKDKLGKLTGAQRGTIVHKAMELMDFSSLNESKNLYQFAKDYKRSLGEKGIFDNVELKAINCKKIANMLKSSLGQRMIKAATRGELFKEQKFSIGYPVSQVYDVEENELTDDRIIVQGIVDGYFVEDGAIVVMDYKTDACDEETLIGRYKAQLIYYADTLSKLRGLPVKEKIMYSFSMEKEIPV